MFLHFASYRDAICYLALAVTWLRRESSHSTRDLYSNNSDSVFWKALCETEQVALTLPEWLNLLLI